MIRFLISILQFYCDLSSWCQKQKKKKIRWEIPRFG